MKPAPPVMRTRIPRKLSAGSDRVLEPFVQRFDDRGRREGLDSTLVGGPAKRPDAFVVGDEPAESVSERLWVARAHEAAGLAERLALRRRVRGDDGAPGGGSLEDLVGNHPHSLGSRPEDAEADVVVGDEGG